MLEPTPIAQLRRRLAQLGCPAKSVRRIVRETGDHYDDLLQAAQQQGLPSDAAAQQAAEQLGDPATLAEQHVARLRQSSWWGRHPLVGFGLLPLAGGPGVFALTLVVGSVLSLATRWGETEAVSHGPAGDQLAVAAFFCGYYAGIIVAAVLFCWLARRSALDFKWALLACSMISIYAFVSYIASSFAPATPQHRAHVVVTVGLFWMKHGSWSQLSTLFVGSLPRAALPLLVAGLAYVRWRRETVLPAEIPST